MARTTSDEPATAPASARVPLVPLSLLSGAALAVEVLLTKFLAYSVSAILVSIVLGIALLGFGAAGTLSAAFPAWAERKEPGNRLAWTSMAFAWSTLVAFAVLVRVTTGLADSWGLTLVAATVLTAPFLCAGLAVALALQKARVGHGYAANLVGSAVGCVVPLALLRAVGGERLVPLLAGVGCVAAFLFARRAPVEPVVRRALVVTAALVALATALATALYAPAPEPAPLGQLSLVRSYAAARNVRERELYDRWNATGRIQIFGYDGVPDAPSPYPFLFYAQDSSAGSTLARWDGRTAASAPPSASEGNSEMARACSETLWAQAYYAPRRRVLVIGLGGGMDVQCALFNGAEHVDVVEINPDSIAAVRGTFDQWVGRIGSNPRVSYHLGDGRAFVHRLRGGEYDVIQLSGVDTKNSSSSGGLALSENTLYTVEAFGDYLANLNGGGVLSIVRFSDPEAVRLSRTAVTALRRDGVPRPEDHIVVRDNSYVRGVLVQKRPFSAADVAAVAKSLTPASGAPRGVSIFFYEAMGMSFTSPPTLEHAPGFPTAGAASLYLTAVKTGLEKEFERLYPFDTQPATDDKPFFFDVFRYKDWTVIALPHVRGLLGVLVSILVLASGLVLLPVLLSRFPVKGVPLSATAFFFFVGLAYLFVEVWLIHRFAMYLGHQAYSLPTVLGALLLSTGLGAALGERLGWSPRRNIGTGVAGIAIVLSLGGLVLGRGLEATAASPFGLRVLLAVAYVGALGFLMGFPFPAGLRWARARIPEAVPWYVGINGFSSVVATLIVIPLSHAFGYEAVMLTGGALYASSVLASVRMRV